MRAAHSRVSFAEMRQWPDDGRRYELYDGEVSPLPSPLPRHQRIAGHVADALRQYERATGGLVFSAPLDIVLSEFDVVQPDVVFFRHERRHVIDMMKPARAVPDLAVEVLSRTTQVRDRGRKLDLLARFGLPEYWLIDPLAHVVEIFSGGPLHRTVRCDDTQDVHSPTLPGLSIAAGRLFQP